MVRRRRRAALPCLCAGPESNPAEATTGALHRIASPPRRLSPTARESRQSERLAARSRLDRGRRTHAARGLWAPTNEGAGDEARPNQGRDHIAREQSLPRSRLSQAVPKHPDPGTRPPTPERETENPTP